jgi:vacuolar-type H+-ATPase subunit F/Vma7
MKTKILIIGRHQQILGVLFRLINQNPDWEGTSASTDEEAMKRFEEDAYDLVLLSSGIEEESENKLREFFIKQNPTIIIIQHYGGGSGLLTGEILQALDNQR